MPPRSVLPRTNAFSVRIGTVPVIVRRLHCSAEVALFIYDRPGRFAFHWLPKHASCLSFIEAWFAILSKQCLQRKDKLVDLQRDAIALPETA